MNIEDFEQFSECWQQAYEGIGREATPKAIEWAFEVLRDKSLDEIMSALIAHAREPKEGQFVPKPANIIRHIDGTKEDRKDAATIAWARVVDSSNRYISPVFDDPSIHYAIMVSFGGDWEDVCNFNSDDFAYQEKRRSFITAYANFKKGMSYQPYFAGLHEKENGQAEITYIGDKAVASLVSENGSWSGLKSISPNIKGLGVLK